MTLSPTNAAKKTTNTTFEPERQISKMPSATSHTQEDDSETTIPDFDDGSDMSEEFAKEIKQTPAVASDNRPKLGLRRKEGAVMSKPAEAPSTPVAKKGVLKKEDGDATITPRRRAPGRTRSRELSVADSKDADAAMAALSGRESMIRPARKAEIRASLKAAPLLGDEKKKGPRRRRAPNRTRSAELSIVDSTDADLAMAAMAATGMAAPSLARAQTDQQFERRPNNNKPRSRAFASSAAWGVDMDNDDSDSDEDDNVMPMTSTARRAAPRGGRRRAPARSRSAELMREDSHLAGLLNAKLALDKEEGK